MNRFALQRLPGLAFATTSLAASVATDHPNNLVLRGELAKLRKGRLNGKEYH